MIKRFQTQLLWLWLLPIMLRAQEFQKIGTTGFVFLEIPVSARHLALGEAGISLPNAGTDGLFMNPALVALNTARMTFNATYANWYVETSHQALGLTYSLPRIGTFGLQAVYFNFGEIEKTINPTAEQTGSYIALGTYTAGAYAIGLTYARSLTDKFSFGSTLKYVQETIDQYSASNVIADIGFLYMTGFGSLRIGAFLQSFGLEAKYANEKFKMPQQLKMGISGELWGHIDSPHRVTLLAEAIHPNDADERIHLGMEAVFSNSVILRTGYKFGYTEENLCLGAGVGFQFKGKRFCLDGAYMNHQYLDTTLRYTLSMEL